VPVFSINPIFGLSFPFSLDLSLRSPDYVNEVGEKIKINPKMVGKM